MNATSPTASELRDQALASLKLASNQDELSTWHSEVLGRQGSLSQALRSIGQLPKEERPGAGQALNVLRQELEEAFTARQDSVRSEALDERLVQERVDVTLPGRKQPAGGLHPLTQMQREAMDVFAHLGFQVVEGPEVEFGRYSFDMLNIPKDHPARDVWDTIFIESDNEEITLRPHTSPMQVRTMLSQDPPVRVIVPGRCYRYEAQDATHEWHFQQIEGLAVDKHITMADLKGTLAEFARQIFGAARKVRFRCDYFPFVEPGVDLSIDCPFCDGKGCRVCSGTGWIEILGAGMVHPNVLAWAGYDPEIYSGWAFGMGIDRLTMLRYGINDIRSFYQNDLRFLRQFQRARL
ncbi:MAG: phenylalanine--tRNA ligase subunit alpha [Thermomicrobiales bacterium]